MKSYQHPRSDGCREYRVGSALRPSFDPAKVGNSNLYNGMHFGWVQAAAKISRSAGSVRHWEFTMEVLLFVPIVHVN